MEDKKEELSESVLIRMNFFIGQTLQGCFRRYYDDHDDFDYDDNLDQELDGDTFLIFSNSEAIGFYADTEAFSLKVGFNVQLENTESVEVSKNLFWKNKIGNSLVDVQLLHSKHRPNPYGIKFILSDGPSFEIVYISESDYTDDAVIIKGGLYKV